MSTVYWKMRNGSLIDVDKMDINHLRNTLKMLIRASQAQVRSSQIANKSSFEGDMAQQFNDGFIVYDEDESPGDDDGYAINPNNYHLYEK